MERGPNPPDEPSNEPGEGGQSPGEGPQAPPPRPQTPAPGPAPGPQAPPAGPQGPPPSAPPPGAPEAPPGAPGPQGPPPAAPGPQAPPPGGAPPPAGPQAPGGMPPAPETPPGYGGPVPPGGWQQPAAMQPGWAGQPLASWWSRVGATLLDGLILLIPVVVFTFIAVAAFAGDDVAGWVFIVLAVIAYLLILIFYAPVLMARGGDRNGQTFGKQIVGIRVVRDTGQPFELGYGFLREIVVKVLLFQWVGSFFLSIPTLLDWLWPLWDDQNRCLHDMVVTTHVVRA